MATHKELDVWKDSIEFVTRIYLLTSDFPDSERYGLVSQMRRSAVSIPSNIAEGASRGSNKEYVRFINISLGSLSELETQIIIAKKLEYLSSTDIIDDLEKIQAMLCKLRNYLKLNS